MQFKLSGFLTLHNFKIEATNFSYKEGIEILHDVFLSASTGEIVGIFGRNGSGKSTLLRLIYGSIKNKSTSLFFDKMYYSSFLRSKIATYLPQDNFTPDKLTVERCIRQFHRSPAIRNAILSDKRISQIANSKIYKLSGGERRFFEFKLLSASEQHIMLLDEPFSQIEPIYTTIMQKEIEIASEKKIFIIVDHSYRDVLKITTRNYYLSNGVLKEINDIDSLRNKGYLPVQKKN